MIDLALYWHLNHFSPLFLGKILTLACKLALDAAFFLRLGKVWWISLGVRFPVEKKPDSWLVLLASVPWAPAAADQWEESIRSRDQCWPIRGEYCYLITWGPGLPTFSLTLRTRCWSSWSDSAGGCWSWSLNDSNCWWVDEEQIWTITQNNKLEDNFLYLCDIYMYLDMSRQGSLANLDVLFLYNCSD